MLLNQSSAANETSVYNIGEVRIRDVHETYVGVLGAFFLKQSCIFPNTRPHPLLYRITLPTAASRGSFYTALIEMNNELYLYARSSASGIYIHMYVVSSFYWWLYTWVYNELLMVTG